MNARSVHPQRLDMVRRRVALVQREAVARIFAIERRP